MPKCARSEADRRVTAWHRCARWPLGARPRQRDRTAQRGEKRWLLTPDERRSSTGYPDRWLDAHDQDAEALPSSADAAGEWTDAIHVCQAPESRPPNRRCADPCGPRLGRRTVAHL